MKQVLYTKESNKFFFKCSSIEIFKPVSSIFSQESKVILLLYVRFLISFLN